MNLKKYFLLFFTLVMLGKYGCYVFAIEPSYVIELSPKERFYLNRNGGISHNTYVIERENDKLFFKETKEKLSMYDTAKRAITEYFKDDYKDAQKSMLKSLLDEENLKKFIYMKTYDDGKAARWINSREKSDTSILGFTEPLPDDFKEKILPGFLHYAFSEFVQYRSNRNREIGELQINQLLGALATMRIATLLDLSDLIVKTEYVKVKIPCESDRLGIIMNCASGVPFKQLASLKTKNVTPSFQ